MNIIEVTPLGWQLDKNSPVWRKPKRKEHLQDNSFRDEYDFSSIFYDIFFSHDRAKIICIGPPLLNLKPFFHNAEYYVSGHDFKKIVCHNITFHEWSPLTELWIDIPEGDYHFLTCKTKMGSFSTRIGKNYSNEFNNMSVVFTKQKNNKLNWISDWININHYLHGVNAAIIFDNASTDYNRLSLISHLASSIAISTVAIVSWPYRFGSVGGRHKMHLVKQNDNKPIPWDSTYTNTAVPQICLFRFLMSAKNAIWSDIDEIILSDNGKKIFDLAENTKSGILKVGSRIIDNIDFVIKDDQVYSDFFTSPYSTKLGTDKYILTKKALNDQILLTTHKVFDRHTRKNISTETDSVQVRHFALLNTLWKITLNKRKSNQYDPSAHFFDCSLVKQLMNITTVLPKYKFPLKEIISDAQFKNSCPRDMTRSNAPKTALFDCNTCQFNIQSCLEMDIIPDIQPHMKENEINLLDKYIPKCGNMIEFGSGGSTAYCLLRNSGIIYSVESDHDWILNIKKCKTINQALHDNRWVPIFVNIGKTVKWGYPESKIENASWLKYHSTLWDVIDPSTIEFVIIDGRFRVACFLQTALRIEKNTPIFIHDFWNRPLYHVLLNYAELIESVENSAILKVKPEVSWRNLALDLLKYQLIPD